MHKENSNITAEEASELKRCADSFEYFCSKYGRVRNPKKGIVDFHLHDFQKRFCQALQDNNWLINCKFRQGGYTTLTAHFCLWKALLHPDQFILWAAPSDREAINCNDLIKLTVDNIPVRLCRWEKINDHSIVFENGSEIQFRSLRSATSCCGKSISLLVIDEPAYVEDMDKKWNALAPCVGNVVLNSTAKTLEEGETNWFFDTLTKAKAGHNSFKVFEADWREHPDFNNDEWANMVRTNLGDIGWRVEIEGEFVVKPKAEKPKEEPKQPDEVKEEVKSEYNHGWRIWHREIKEPKLVERKNDWEDMPLFKKSSWYESDAEGPIVKSDIEPETIDLNETSKIKPGQVNWASRAPLIEHPGFEDEFNMNCDEIWQNIAQVMPDTEVPKHLEKDESFGSDYYNRVNVDVLRLSGVLNEKGTLPLEPDFHETMLKKITKGLPRQLKVDIGGDALCVNGVPTKINAKAVEMAVLGLAELSSQDKAVETVSRIVRKKLQRLF